MVSTRLSTFRLDPASALGIAGQIRAHIALLVADGELEPGAQLPSVRALADQLGTNVNTVRAAYGRLQSDGLVQTRHGVGTVVLPASADRLAHGSSQLGSNTIAVLIAGLNPFYLPLLRAIEDVAAAQGTLVLLADTRDSSTLATAIIRRLVARGVDGIIAVSAGGLDEETTRGRRQGRPMPPIVYIDQPDRKGYSFVFDGDRAGYLATRHLVEHGHEVVACVDAPLSWPNAREVHGGYRRAIEETTGHPLVSEVDAFTVEAGQRAMAHLLDAATPPTAVFAAGEVLTLGVLQEARARGLDVPRELAVIGYTDSPTATFVDPPLTMVSVPAALAGAAAMRALQTLIAGKRPSSQRTVLDIELTIRASCGCH